MRRGFAVGCVLAGLVLSGTPAGGAADVPVLTLDGAAVDALTAPRGVTALVFLFPSTDCPISNRYAPEVQRLVAKIARQGVAFRLVYPNPAEQAPAIRAHMAAFGYEDETADVTITTDQTTTRVFALEPLATVTVAGQVTDGSGHGWPLYALVRAAGTPVSGYTNPLTGEYSLRLPAQATYTIVVTSEYPGYGSASDAVEVGDEDVVHDVELFVEQCGNAPGYEFGATIGIRCFSVRAVTGSVMSRSWMPTRRCGSAAGLPPSSRRTAGGPEMASAMPGRSIAVTDDDSTAASGTGA